MRLADFIDSNIETIVEAAATFASTLLPAAGRLDTEELRDHLPHILEAISADLRSPQTGEESLAKSLGQVLPTTGAPKTAAHTHALLRAKDGFHISQVCAEYRALRASVLRLWAASGESADAETIVDMVRFNEAIDQAVSESMACFAAEVDRWRSLFLGAVGHDLRNPLNAILVTSMALSKQAVDEPVSLQVQRLIQGGERMNRLLDDLLDFNRASLGLGIDIRRAPVDLAIACQEEIELLKAALPDRQIDLLVDGDVQGSFDASRVREVLANLVSNAAKYGAATSSIRVFLTSRVAEIELAVENDVAPTPFEDPSVLFEPLRRGADVSVTQSGDRSSLGLGLFIVREIARSHGGDATGVSEQGATRFTVTLAHTAESHVPLN